MSGGSPSAPKNSTQPVSENRKALSQWPEEQMPFPVGVRPPIGGPPGRGPPGRGGPGLAGRAPGRGGPPIGVPPGRGGPMGGPPGGMVRPGKPPPPGSGAPLLAGISAPTQPPPAVNLMSSDHTPKTLHRRPNAPLGPPPGPPPRAMQMLENMAEHKAD